MIRRASYEDAEAIAQIYNHYIETTVITFEEIPVSGSEVIDRMGDLSEDLPWFLEEVNGEVRGYAYASKWSGRCAYRRSAETSIFSPGSAFRS